MYNKVLIQADPVDVDLHLQTIKNEFDGLNITKSLVRNRFVEEKINIGYDILLDALEYDEVRKYMCNIKIHDKSYKMQFNVLIYHLMLWRPIIRLGHIDDIDGTFIMETEKFSSGLFESFVNEKIIKKYRGEVSFKKLNRILDDLVTELAQISIDFNIITGLSINLDVFINLANKYPEYNEIIRTKLDEGMQPAEIEKLLNSKLNRALDIIVSDTDINNTLRPMVITGTGIKPKQLSEMTINGGFKPDISGRTIPIPINANFLVGGIGSVTNYALDAMGGRKAQIMNKEEMGNSGIFSRKVIMITSQEKLSEGIEDCKSTRPIELVIENKDFLKRLGGRNYKMIGERNYREVDINDTSLVGKTILLRSPITCASEKICKTCYGRELHAINKDISAGGYAAIRITEPVSQNILSAKHILITDSVLLVFNTPRFDDFFNIYSNEIKFNMDFDEDISQYALVLNKDSLIKKNEYDENDFNSFTTAFAIRNMVTGDIIPFVEESGSDLFLSPDLISALNRSARLIDGKFYQLPLTEIEEDSILFLVEIANNELTKPLYDIISLLNRSTHLGCTTMDEMIQKLLSLLVISKIKAESVHAEMIIRALIRSKYDKLQKPNYSRFITDDDYIILTVDAALKENPSPLISISSLDLKRQLVYSSTYRKNAKSYIDALFKKKLK